MNDGKEHLDALKAAADPGRVAVALGLRGKGRRFFCPSCQADGGKTPDLSVNAKGFNCFKCGLKGDLLKLIEVAGKLSFPDAVRWLESLTGIRAPDRRKGGYRNKDKAISRAPGLSCGAVSVAGRAGKAESRSGPDPAVYDAFLTACRPVEGRALDWLTKDKGIAADVIVALGLRFCGKEYPGIMDGLKTRFPEA
ncbi:MAG: CHC2 zinc finger domain-containing protein, partial [Sphaerochaeta sp.]|nr:CHC2 zinc finger domain-containing protein [Sphaerochaeta sp.]